MRFLNYLAIISGVLLYGLSLQSQAALASLVHALPPLADAIPANNPVDIAINSKCEYQAQPYGAKIGPKDTKAGEYTVLFYEANEKDPCRGRILGEITITMVAGDEVDVVLGLNEQDIPQVSLWNNIASLDALEEKQGITAVEFRHVGAGPTMKAILNVAGEESQSSDVQPGDSELMESPAGKASVALKKGRDTLDIDRGKLKAGRAYWVYITGSEFRKTTELLVLRSVPKQRPIPDQATPPRTIEPEYSSCCVPGDVCVQLSTSSCRTSSGIYIGNASCSPNPC